MVHNSQQGWAKCDMWCDMIRVVICHVIRITSHIITSQIFHHDASHITHNDITFESSISQSHDISHILPNQDLIWHHIPEWRSSSVWHVVSLSLWRGLRCITYHIAITTQDISHNIIWQLQNPIWPPSLVHSKLLSVICITFDYSRLYHETRHRHTCECYVLIKTLAILSHSPIFFWMTTLTCTVVENKC